jgi:hypothetical protein
VEPIALSVYEKIARNGASNLTEETTSWNYVSLGNNPTYPHPA